MYVLRYIALFILGLLLFNTEVKSQCQLDDGDGNPSANPIYIGCSQVTSANDTSFIIVITPSNNFGAWTMNWGDGTTSSGASLNPPATINHTYISVTNNGTVFADTFNFTFVSGTCTIPGIVVSGYPVTANIEVPGGLTQLTCAPGTLEFINNSNGASGLPVMPGTVFTWDWGDGSPLEVFNYTNAGDTVLHTYQRQTVNCVTQVDLTATNPCNLSPSVNSQSPVLIYDLDDAAIAASATVLCYPDTVVNFANGSNFNCYAQGNTDQRYERWNFGNYWGLGYDSIVDWRPSGPPLGTPNPNPIPIAFPGIGTYTVNMIDSNLCGQEPASIVIQIVPPPQADMSGDDTICVGEVVTFQNLSTGGANVFAWDFGDGTGFITTGGGNQTHLYVDSGTYTVRLAIGIAGSNCVDTAFWTVVVNPSPTALISFSPASACDSLTVTFADSSLGNPVNWFWDFDNGNTSTNQNPGQEFYGFPANYAVSLTVSNSFGCTDSIVEMVNVYQTPVPLFSPTAVCAGAVSQFVDSSSHASGDPIISWDWNFGDGSPNSNLQNPTHIYALAGTYDVILSVSTANCSAQDTIQVVAEQLPTAAFSMDTTQGCSPLLVNFTNNSSANAVTYLWQFSDQDTSTQVNPQFVFNNNFGIDTNYYINLIAYTSFGCTDTATESVTVFPNPVAQFDDNVFQFTCTPAVITFSNQSTNGATSYFWDFDNGNTSTQVNPSDSLINNSLFTDTFFVSLVAFSANGCSDTAIETYFVWPTAASLPDTMDSGCVPLPVQFPPLANSATQIWFFGDGQTSTSSAPNHLYVTAQDFVASVATNTSNGCKDTSYSLVRVRPVTQAQFTTNLFNACAPAEVEFTSQSVGASRYYWDFGDGVSIDTTDTIVTHIFENTSGVDTTYTVRLVTENAFGCYDTAFLDVTIHPEVFAGFEHDTAGCSVFGVLFINQSIGASLYGWHFGDGTTSAQKNPAKAYINNTKIPETYTVSLVASTSQGCRDSIASELTVYPQPNANFAVNPPTNTLTYPDTIFGFNNLEFGWDYLWDFGDSTTSSDSTITEKAYTGWGEFNVNLVAFNEFCSDTMTQLVTILPPVPIADFGDSTAGCEDLTVEFVNKSKYADTYFWRFVNSTTNAAQSSAEKDPTITFTDPGFYNVELTVSGEGGEDEKTKFGYIQVYEQPQADFTFAPEEVFIPNEAVVFFNNSRGDNLSYSWNFGDGNTSSAENPEHYYKAEGEYIVTLVASNGFCEDTKESISPVLAKPSGSVTTPNAFTPNTGSDPGINGAYDFSTPGYDRTSNNVFYPVIVGEIKKYEFMIFNKWGELLFRTDRETVGWTGWYRDQLCQQDVYVFRVNATLIDNSEVVLAGDVTLLR